MRLNCLRRRMGAWRHYNLLTTPCSSSRVQWPTTSQTHMCATNSAYYARRIIKCAKCLKIYINNKAILKHLFSKFCNSRSRWTHLCSRWFLTSRRARKVNPPTRNSMKSSTSWSSWRRNHLVWIHPILVLPTRIWAIVTWMSSRESNLQITI